MERRDNANPLRVAVCIITCKRPAGLRKLLCHLEKLEFKRIATPLVHVFVVDNSEGKEGVSVCKDMYADYRWGLTYGEEKRKGIPFARNHVVWLARYQSDFIAMIDDDEYPVSNWLEDLLITQEKYRADIVSGPVIPAYEVKPPDWAMRGKFYERPRMPTGTHSGVTRTGNILFKTAIFDKHAEPWFDPRLAMTGGSDVLFLQGLHDEGFLSIWSDEAVVYETVPESRMSPKWLLERAFRLGSTFIRSERIKGQSLLGRIRSVLYTFALLTFDLISIPTCIFGKVQSVKVVRRICREAGKIWGLLNFEYNEYEKIHGK